MKVSVAICTWNRCESLRRTLEALTTLRIPEGVTWELVVVNNNGTDNTDQVALSFQDRLPLRLIQEPTAGLSYARNRAIQSASGDVMLWTDDDVLVDAGWLEGLTRGFETFEADVVFGPSKANWDEGAPPDWFSSLHHGKFGVIDYGPAGFVVPDLSTPFFGLNFGIKRDVLVGIGGFCEELGVKEETGGGEDIDLYRRLHLAGRRIVYVPDALVYHVIPTVRMSRDYYRQRLRAGMPMYYKMLEDQYPAAPWLFGVPRFFYSKLVSDALGYTRSLLSGDKPARFHYELQVLKFTGVFRQAAVTRRVRAGTSEPSVRGHQA